MAKMLAIKGNRTTTGGEVLEGDESFSDDNGALAKNMGFASCPRCGHNGPMLGTASGWGLTGASAVRDGDIVACQCPRGTNRVIARSTYYDSE
ncbi:PAAR domain-containing protein [Paraburkholderia diazotrophica]|uniref:PAAR motif-containing protein n=1 Tax=Paraburkholderia diazotrophica TaxID=667676 RepID=A0A1H7CFC3_9BURK|nr:PAAR domain-containing protein [Paraburkholderia diazotrophica]SEJ87964.1 PAAR motif-containing protein [Paraburkholderia diazotrophica]